MPPVTATGKPNPKPPAAYTGPGCGTRNCGIFRYKPGCGLFGCDGGCGIFGCGGGCGILGCILDCPLGLCSGLGCVIPGGCGNTQGTNGGNINNQCEKPVTASACTYTVTTTSAWSLASSIKTTKVSKAILQLIKNWPWNRLVAQAVLLVSGKTLK